MSMKSIIFIFCGGLYLSSFTAGFAASESLDGAKLSELCQSKGATAENLTCTAYFSGLVEGMIAADYGRSNGKPICLPNEGHIETIRSLVQEYIGDHPELRERPAYVSVILALVKAYPCAKANSSDTSKGK